MKKSTSKLIKTARKIPSLDWIVLGLGVTVFVLLALHNITKSSIWFDEAFSAYITQFSFADIARYTATDVHPPMYYWVLKIWTDFFGTTELAFRSLSVLFGTTTITFGFLLVKRMFGRRSAWLGLLLMVISPMLIRYSQEARMYTMAATIALSATYVLTVAMATKKRRMWVLYGVLVGLGMWTHYFTAIVWLAHWAWRAIVIRQSGARGKKYRLAFFSRDWIIAHVVAVGLFLPWIPFMAIQLLGVQGTGFWIGPVGVYTFPNYLSNVLFYLEQGQAQGWYAVAMVAIVSILSFYAVKLYKSLNKKQRQNYLLLVCLAFVPVVLLFIASIPPLKSSFVERYLVPSAVGFSLLAGVTLAIGMDKVKSKWRVVATSVLVIGMLFGVSNVFYYGNFSKTNSLKINTGEVVKEIQVRARPGEPIIASSPWVFYEAIFYNTNSNPVYFIDSTADYKIGSLKMLKEHSQHKIQDISVFAKEHAIVWIVSNAQQGAVPYTGWTELQRFAIYDPISKNEPYNAVQYQTN